MLFFGQGKPHSVFFLLKSRQICTKTRILTSDSELQRGVRGVPSLELPVEREHVEDHAPDDGHGAGAWLVLFHLTKFERVDFLYLAKYQIEFCLVGSVLIVVTHIDGAARSFPVCSDLLVSLDAPCVDFNERIAVGEHFDMGLC